MTYSFDSVARKCAEGLQRKYETVSLLTDSQHLHEIESTKKIFEDHGYNVIIGRGKGQLRDAQVFGCEFYPAYNIQKRVDAYVFLGQSMFHSASVAMSTEKPTFMLDIISRNTQETFAQGMQKRAILSIYKALTLNRHNHRPQEGTFAKVRALEHRGL